VVHKRHRPIARTLADAELLLQHMDGYDERESVSVHGAAHRLCERRSRRTIANASRINPLLEPRGAHAQTRRCGGASPAADAVIFTCTATVGAEILCARLPIEPARVANFEICVDRQAVAGCTKGLSVGRPHVRSVGADPRTLVSFPELVERAAE
jgi:hypothetical protein